jgi:hypothetical protein
MKPFLFKINWSGQLYFELDRSHLELDRSHLELDRSHLELDRSHLEHQRLRFVWGQRHFGHVLFGL